MGLNVRISWKRRAKIIHTTRIDPTGCVTFITDQYDPYTYFCIILIERRNAAKTIYRFEN